MLPMLAVSIIRLCILAGYPGFAGWFCWVWALCCLAILFGYAGWLCWLDMQSLCPDRPRCLCWLVMLSVIFDMLDNLAGYSENAGLLPWICWLVMFDNLANWLCSLC
jgi:hypothetical protein